MKSVALFLLLTLVYGTGQIDTLQFVDSIYKKLTIEERIGQLLALPVYSNRDEKYEAELIKTITTVQPGFLIYFQGTIQSHAKLHNKLMPLLKVPPFLSMDAEYGVGMRLKDALAMPKALTIAATGDTMNAYRVGLAIGKQCKALKLHVNYAPVVDVNNNPLNPVIGVRAFGEHPDVVVSYARNYIHGLFQANVFPVIKHFPGHGNTTQDSHEVLSTVKIPQKELQHVHLYPFKKLIQANLAWGVMVGHLFVPKLDEEKKPSTLSYEIVTKLLQDAYGFRGLVFTDALSMEGAKFKNKPGKIEVQALQAGNDVLLMPSDADKAVQAIKEALEQKLILSSIFEQKVKKILYHKLKHGLFYENLLLDTEKLSEQINSADFVQLKKNIYSQSIVLLRNEDFLPLDTRKNINFIIIGKDNESFYEELSKFVKFSKLVLPIDAKPDSVLPIVDSLLMQNNADQVIICFHSLTNSLKNNPLKNWKSFIYQIAQKIPVLLCLLGNPFHLQELDHINALKGLILGFESDSLMQIAMARALVGVQSIQGKLPVTLHRRFPAGSGLTLEQFKDIFIENASSTRLNTCYLDSIDALINKAIADSVMPGCQVMAIWNGQVIYHKHFGKHTYEGQQPVRWNDLCDLASLTKILATTLAIMRLYEENKIELEVPLKVYLPELAGTGVGETNIARILTHSAGFPPFIPFYKKTLTREGPSQAYYSSFPDTLHTIEVAENLFLNKHFKDTIWKTIISLKLNKHQGYKYSDLGMIVLGRLIEHLTNKPLDKYVEEEFYKPLGLNYLGYNPRKWYPVERIVPTENDTAFRKQLIRGYVHDQTAAMLGGVAGHAGLFGNAHNVAVIMYMLANGGTYRGMRFFQTETIRKFTSIYYDKIPRGLGFDKPGRGGNTSEFTSPKSFGHSGFTGTYTWADPTYGLVYVFLSNRVYPSSDNWKISTTNLRTKILDYLYKVITTY